MDNTQDNEESPKTLAQQLAELPRKIAGMPVDLSPPVIASERTDICTAAFESQGNAQRFTRVACAALALCSPKWRRMRELPRYEAASYDILKYGGQVYDFLLGHGADGLEVLRAGSVAVQLTIDSAVTEEQVKRAEGFLSRHAEPERSNSSGSSARGTSDPASSGPSTPSSSPS